MSSDTPSPPATGTRPFPGLPVEVALDELRALEQAESEGARPRLWSDTPHRPDAPAPVGPPPVPVGAGLVAIIADDEPAPIAADAPVAGGPQFAGVPGASRPVGPSGVRSSRRDARVPPLPGTLTPAWVMPEPPKRSWARRARRRVAKLVILAMLGTGAYLAYPRVRAFITSRSVPASLRAYVGGNGVQFSPAGEGYSVRLPGAPVRRDPLLTSSDHRLSTVAHWSIAAGRDYQIVVSEADLPAPVNAVVAGGLLGALRDPMIRGSGDLSGVRQVRIAGAPAYEAELHSGRVVAFEVAVFVHAGRLFVIRVESASAGTVLDAVARSFRFSS